jgi:DNA polymerase III epsilon subunit-like protein
MMDIINLLFDEPDEKGFYPHLIVCNSSGREPIGVWGTTCSCLNSPIFKRLQSRAIGREENMKNKFLVFDTETGGLTSDTSLLTAWFGVYNGRFELLDSLDLKVKPTNGIYNITAQGLGVNKIDIVKHDAEAVTLKEAGTKLYNFLNSNTKLGGDKLIPVGQNVQFDIKRVTNDLISEGSWDCFVSYRVLDTMVIARFLEVTGKLEILEGISLGNLAHHFGVRVDGNPHEAEYDARVTVEVLKNLMKLV